MVQKKRHDKTVLNFLNNMCRQVAGHIESQSLGKAEWRDAAWMARFPDVQGLVLPVQCKASTFQVYIAYGIKPYDPGIPCDGRAFTWGAESGSKACQSHPLG